MSCPLYVADQSERNYPAGNPKHCGACVTNLRDTKGTPEWPANFGQTCTTTEHSALFLYGHTQAHYLFLAHYLPNPQSEVSLLLAFRGRLLYEEKLYTHCLYPTERVMMIRVPIPGDESDFSMDIFLRNLAHHGTGLLLFRLLPNSHATRTADDTLFSRQAR